MNMPAKPEHLLGRTRRGLAEIARTGLGRGVPYVSIEGQSFTLIDENGQTKPIVTPYLDCVVIDVTPIVGRVFWGVENGYGSHVKNYPGKGQAYTPPVCFSDNGVGASNAAQDPQATNCKGCQWSVWGSAISRLNGKDIPACGSTKKIAIYAKPDWDKPGIAFPFLLRIPIMSHDNFKHYLSLFTGQDFDIDEVWTRISFVHGAQGLLQFEPVSKYDPTKLWVDDEADAAIGDILDHKLTDQLVGRGDMPWQGPVAQVAGPGAPAATLAPPPAAAPSPFGQGSAPAGFGQGPVPQQAQIPPTQPAATAAQPGTRKRGRPPKPTGEQAQNPAPAGVSTSPPASGFTAPPAAPPPATSAPFGMATGAPPPSEVGNAITNAFGLPTGRGS